MKSDKTLEYLLDQDGMTLNKHHKILRIGIMSYENFQKYTIAIAKGEYKRKPNEPKLWFTSLQSLANVLSEENQKLLRLITDEHPQSISELESLTGRNANNILRTLRTMENYGLVELLESKEKKRGRPSLIPRVLFNTTDIQIHFA